MTLKTHAYHIVSNQRFAVGVVAFLLLAALVAGATLAASAAGAQPAVQKSTSPVLWFEDPGQVAMTEVEGGSTTLQRSPSGLSMIFHATELNPGHAYTVWWVVLEGDTMGVLYAAGNFASPNGTSTFAGHLRPGDESGCVEVEPFDAHCFPLDDQYEATIMLVLHDHGPLLPGQVAQQIGSFEGGCLEYDSPAFGTHVYNLGHYTCFSNQVSVHAP
jgi:hypothetical protein